MFVITNKQKTNPPIPDFGLGASRHEFRQQAPLIAIHFLALDNYLVLHFRAGGHLHMNYKYINTKRVAAAEVVEVLAVVGGVIRHTSVALHALRFKLGSKKLFQRSRHCLPHLPGMNFAI